MVKIFLAVLILLCSYCETEPQRHNPTYEIGGVMVRCYQKKGTGSCFCCNAWLDRCHAQHYASAGFTDCSYPRAWNIHLIQVP